MRFGKPAEIISTKPYNFVRSPGKVSEKNMAAKKCLSSKTPSGHGKWDFDNGAKKITEKREEIEN